MTAVTGCPPKGAGMTALRNAPRLRRYAAATMCEATIKGTYARATLGL